MQNIPKMYQMGDDLSGDMLASSRRNVVVYVYI